MEIWESHHRKGLDIQNEKQIPMQSDIDSSGASFTEGPLFRIFDCIPDWGLSDVETKVMVLVDILGGVNLPSTMKWFCKFGEVEVPGQLLTPNTLRCYAPPHGPGRIPIYVTYGNGRPCSNVYEFEYVHKQCTQLSDEKKFQQRILHMMKFEARSMQTELEVTLWKTLRIARYFRYKFNRNDPRASTFERDLKVEFFEWLIISVHKEDNKLNVLDEEGQGIIHLLSALGYQWAIRPLVAAGANPNFRDAHGWTALHWAASYGREETVVTLIRLGAAPDALDDPTSEFPEGRTASDLASIKGHESIARYLAETHPTRQHSHLTLEKTVMDDGVSSTTAADKSMVSQQSCYHVIGIHRYFWECQKELVKCRDENSVIRCVEMLVASLNEKTDCSIDPLCCSCKIPEKQRSLKVPNRIVKTSD